MNEQTKVGIGLLGCGAFFAFLGVILFFDRGLLALSNIFSSSGVVLLLGWQSTWQLFTKKMNYKGSISFLVGLFLIFVRWPIVGIILEIYGILVVFRDFWPAAKTFICHIPVVGWLLQYPFLAGFIVAGIVTFGYCILEKGRGDYRTEAAHICSFFLWYVLSNSTDMIYLLNSNCRESKSHGLHVDHIEPYLLCMAAILYLSLSIKC